MVSVAAPGAGPAGTGSDNGRCGQASARACRAGALIVVTERARRAPGRVQTSHSPGMRFRRCRGRRDFGSPTGKLAPVLPDRRTGARKIKDLRAENAGSRGLCCSSGNAGAAEPHAAPGAARPAILGNRPAEAGRARGFSGARPGPALAEGIPGRTRRTHYRFGFVTDATALAQLLTPRSAPGCSG